MDSTRLTDCFEALEVSPVKPSLDKTPPPPIQRGDKSTPIEEKATEGEEGAKTAYTSDESEKEDADDDDEEYVASDDIYTSDEDDDDASADDSPKKTKPRNTRTRAKRPEKSKDDLVYLDLSSERVIEAHETSNNDVAEEDLKEITRRFLEDDVGNEG